MPKPPLIASEGARASVIAVLMLLLLAASLGLAYGLVVLPAPARYDLALGEPQHVGDLTIDIPQGWRPTDLGDGFKEFETAVRFSDRHNAQRQMIVGSLILDSPQAPLAVRQFLLATSLGRVGSQRIIAGPAYHEIQVGRMSGLRYTAATETAEGVQERFVAVMSADDRRQWVMVLSQFVETPALLKQRILADDQAFEKICKSAVLPTPPGVSPGVPELPGATTRNEVKP